MNYFNFQNILEKWTKKPSEKLRPFEAFNLSDFSGAISLRELLNSFDIFFICFDEPNRKKNWRQIKKNFSHAQKVEGVVGFDEALKTCAHLSKTKHFFVIDGDNKIIENKIDQPLLLNNFSDDWVLSWSAQNSVNGLAYGNGGLKLWPKQEALRIRSHEKASLGEDPTDYCFLSNYYQIDNYLTQTNINETAFQAFRAGFREGVKMSLVWGKQKKLTRENYDVVLGPENRERLWVWCNVGADANNGLWAIYGARLGFKLNAVDLFDYKLINSYSWFQDFWIHKIIGKYRIEKSQAFSYSGAPEELYQEIKKVGEVLSTELSLNMKFFSADESEDFKESFKNPRREGILFQS